MSKFHVSASGELASCTASVRDCPRGEVAGLPHFDTFEEGVVWLAQPREEPEDEFGFLDDESFNSDEFFDEWGDHLEEQVPLSAEEEEMLPEDVLKPKTTDHSLDEVGFDEDGNETVKRYGYDWTQEDEDRSRYNAQVENEEAKARQWASQASEKRLEDWADEEDSLYHFAERTGGDPVVSNAYRKAAQEELARRRSGNSGSGSNTPAGGVATCQKCYGPWHPVVECPNFGRLPMHQLRQEFEGRQAKAPMHMALNQEAKKFAARHILQSSSKVSTALEEWREQTQPMLDSQTFFKVVADTFNAKEVKGLTARERLTVIRSIMADPVNKHPDTNQHRMINSASFEQERAKCYERGLISAGVR